MVANIIFGEICNYLRSYLHNFCIIYNVHVLLMYMQLKIIMQRMNAENAYMLLTQSTSKANLVKKDLLNML